MLFRIVICVILLLAGHKILAQDRPVEDSEPAPNNSKTASHYIGIQANQLIRQLISFGGNNSAITNPYLLTWSVNSKSNGAGFSTGLGYSSVQTKTTDQFITTTSKVDDFAWRFGFEKKSYLSRNWLLSFGGDILIESNKAETTSSSGSVNNPTITTTTKRSGFGPRLSLNYQFHHRLMIGTEASYYFKFINQKQKVTGNGSPNPSSNDQDTHLRSFTLTLPAVVFLIMKF
jgi:hypothetical protein